MSAQRSVRGCPTGSLTFPGRDSRSEPGQPGGAQAAGTSRRQARPRSPQGPPAAAQMTRGGAAPAPAQVLPPTPPRERHKSRAVFSRAVRLRRRVSQK